ncbi:hypothetical protein A2631_04100 [Candidatus Daviesbacteria bacterium RIFCSPHIGHO2_01_FULL_44_29]|uniref:Magnesium chelatase n=1 Tax=Candidatus Daviesbacteria bacterium RIFCSPHIGHO2_02_FULL_43_12 TaxID=1797776 RepID=A0A1F5KG39_9BACT|nr:MAG: hypothetical protein A2631_04100 [Candidatus Daviesbacteria bacterium RIFCSPHIGHO2_01_FULL_44_29]OGE39912.1 MAG: hypothetical protein A3D25_03830 [Candidatus Daviesbacteria bacterium RIFCSPHIGHO2_02_FULL_43_12]OGE40530.1 MAG: hypothetical protein A3E86_00960 [Candidatus Daviesbacteria bacterium RIFCSPHIGHO2_12_FULL_47_45]OGE70407.1 MAG: hypothetical protein A3B55_01740 [Candidatus Daviesbacteria bacterium RIFCSPLOWO2_01_FULL_43_15]
MLAKVLSGALNGLEGTVVVIEADIASLGLPSFTIVGLADRAIEEKRVTESLQYRIRDDG